METPKLTAMEAFNHLFQLDPHEGESEDDHQARMIMRDEFIKQCEAAGITPSEYHGMLMRQGDHTVAKPDEGRIILPQCDVYRQ